MLKLYVKCRLDVYKRQTDSVFQVGGASSNCLKKRDYQKSLSTGGSLPGSFTTLPLLLGSNPVSYTHLIAKIVTIQI